MTALSGSQYKPPALPEVYDLFYQQVINLLSVPHEMVAKNTLTNKQNMLDLF